MESVHGLPVVAKGDLFEVELNHELSGRDGFERHRAALRNAVKTGSMFTSARLYGVDFLSLKKFHHELKLKTAREFDLRNSPFSLKKLLALTEPSNELLIYLRRTHGETGAAKFCRVFFLLEKEKTLNLLSEPKERAILSREHFDGYFGFKAIARRDGINREIVVALGGGDLQDTQYKFELRCETYEKFVDLMDGLLDIYIVDITGFMAKTMESDVTEVIAESPMGILESDTPKKAGVGFKF